MVFWIRKINTIMNCLAFALKAKIKFYYPIKRNLKILFRAKNWIFLSIRKAIASTSNSAIYYTLPITHLMLPNTLSNQTVADWLGRFLRDETFIQIYDNFLLTPNEINAFNKYILPFIQKGASIHIYTAAENNITEEYIQQEFLKPKYASWKFCVYVMKVKNDLHERAIQTNNIIIHLDKGLALFGAKGHIPTSPISITANIESSRIRISDKQCRQLIGGN